MTRQQQKGRQAGRGGRGRRISPWLLLIPVFLVVAGVVFWNSRNATLPSAGCITPVQLSAYPPVAFTADPTEGQIWVQGYQGEDPVGQVEWVQNQLARSSMPIAHETGSFLMSNTPNFQVDFRGNAPSGITYGITMKEGRLLVQANLNALQGPNRRTSTDLALATIHEALHIRELISQKNTLVSQGITERDAYLQLQERYKDPNQSRCAEMRAFALEVAAYWQFKQLGYRHKDYEEFLQVLEGLNWQWNTQRWSDLTSRERQRH